MRACVRTHTHPSKALEAAFLLWLPSQWTASPKSDTRDVSLTLYLPDSQFSFITRWGPVDLLSKYLFCPATSFQNYYLSLGCNIRAGNGTSFQYSCLENPMDGGAWWAAVHGVAKSWTRLSDFTFTFHFHALEKATATHSSVLAWKIPGAGEPGGLLSMGSHRVGHD